MNIFVSYTAKDLKKSVQQMRKVEISLKSMGMVYIDLLHNRSETPQEYVISKLGQSSVVVLCVTPNFLQSRWVQYEIITALQRNIPIYGYDPFRLRFLNTSRPISNQMRHIFGVSPNT